jgi:hypothetical protein
MASVATCWITGGYPYYIQFPLNDTGFQDKYQHEKHSLNLSKTTLNHYFFHFARFFLLDDRHRWLPPDHQAPDGQPDRMRAAFES